jgi:hypothetical protein
MKDIIAMNEAERYSPKNFEAAKKEGAQTLTPEEKRIWDRFEEIERDWMRETLAGGLSSAPGMMMLSKLIVDVVDRDRRSLRFGEGKEVKADLEQKILNSPPVQKQMELAREEAEEMNREYNRRAGILVQALKEFQEYSDKVNGREVSESSGSL